MWAYITRRLLWLPILLLAVSLITFALGRFAPSDPVRIRLGNRYTPEKATILRREMGLDRPFWVQYGDYMWGVTAPKLYSTSIVVEGRRLVVPLVRFDLGESSQRPGQSVTKVIGPKMWVSAQLALAALVIAIGVGLPLGFFIAHKQGSWEDPSAVTLSLVLMSIPVMVTVPLLLWVFCLKLDWVSCGGTPFGLFRGTIVVPALAMGVPGIAGFTRLMRAVTLDVMGQDFIRTANAKGLSPLTVDTRHVLRNAMIPIITILAFSLAGLIGGAFITETIMGIPGIGRFAVDAIFSRDYDVIMAITLIGAFAFVLANLLADLAYAFIDPRIRYQ